MDKKIKKLSPVDINNICSQYSKRDTSGYSHCKECPLCDHKYNLCIRNDHKWFISKYGEDVVCV